MNTMSSAHASNPVDTSGSRVLVITGSPSQRSRTAMVGSYVGNCLQQKGFAVEELRARDLPAEALLRADFEDAELRKAFAAVEAADGVVLCTPTYKAAYSGLLKSFLDMLPQFGFAGKAILPLATGGSTAHVLALDYALRPVVHSMGARHVVQSHFLLDRDVMQDDDGTVSIAEQGLPMLNAAISAFELALGAVSVEAVAARF